MFDKIIELVTSIDNVQTIILPRDDGQKATIRKDYYEHFENNKLKIPEEVIDGLKSGHIGYFGMDVYEEEKGLFFEDHSEDILQDDMISRLMTLRNVMITSHQAFLTDTALKIIAKTTIENLECLEKGLPSKNEVGLR